MGELLRLKFVALAERARHWLENEDDPWGAFEGFLRESAEGTAADRAQQRMMWLATPEAFELAREAQMELAKVGGKIIKRAQKAGTLRKDWSSADMPTLMCGLTSSMQMAERTGPGHVRHDWRRLLDIALDGVRATR
jgi:hypothetical protein